MKARVYGLLGILGIVTLAALVVPNYAAAGSQGQMGQLPYADAILNATVQINMYALTDEIRQAGLPDKNLSVAQVQDYIAQGWGYALGQGLGTVVSLEGRKVIVTHYHWDELLLTADLVELLDAKGRTLANLTLNEFKKLTLFIDGGTLILAIPEGLKLTPALVAQEKDVTPGKRLLVARRNRVDGKTVELVEAVVEGEKYFKGQPCWQIRTLNNKPIIPGDSGGGAWLNGAFVGNNWARVLEYDRLYWARQALKEEVGEQVVVVAQLPDEIVSELANNFQIEEDAELRVPVARRQELIEK
jgi:hypothetical protein